MENPVAPERIFHGMCGRRDERGESTPGRRIFHAMRGRRGPNGLARSGGGCGLAGVGGVGTAKSACPLASGVLICKHKLQDSDTPSEIQERR